MENIVALVKLENDHVIEVQVPDNLSELLILKIRHKVFCNPDSLHNAIVDYCNNHIKENPKLIRRIDALYIDALDRNLNGILYGGENRVGDITPPLFTNLLTSKKRRTKRIPPTIECPLTKMFCSE